MVLALRAALGGVLLFAAPPLAALLPSRLRKDGDRLICEDTAVPGVYVLLLFSLRRRGAVAGSKDDIDEDTGIRLRRSLRVNPVRCTLVVVRPTTGSESWRPGIADRRALELNMRFLPEISSGVPGDTVESAEGVLYTDDDFLVR